MDEVTQAIEASLQILKANIANHELKLEEAKAELAKLTKSRMCIHDWKNTGGFMYATYECTKCGYRWMDS